MAGLLYNRWYCRLKALSEWADNLGRWVDWDTVVQQRYKLVNINIILRIDFSVSCERTNVVLP
jgi:hypothetical protein